MVFTDSNAQGVLFDPDRIHYRRKHRGDFGLIVRDKGGKEFRKGCLGILSRTSLSDWRQWKCDQSGK
jgi:hypothetical protein